MQTAISKHTAEPTYDRAIPNPNGMLIQNVCERGEWSLGADKLRVS